MSKKPDERATKPRGAQTIVKCSILDEKFVRPCTSLSSVMMPGHPRGKQRGIFSWVLTNLQTHERSRTFFGVKSGAYTEKGLAFNFCPFCGESIDAPFKESNND